MRKFIGNTADRPEIPEVDGDIFIDVDQDKKYVALGGVWYETTKI